MDSSQLHSTSSSEAMGEAYEGGSGRSSKEIEGLPLQISKYPRNLLQIFSTNNPRQPHQIERVKQQEEEEDVELNLGLSLGGKFGVDKSHCRLIRSSSVAGTTPLIREEHMEMETPPAALVRTASLPSETEEEWRKRKEMQTLRRMEAKRRRSEKQMNVRESGEERGGGAGKGTEGLLNLNLRGKLEKEERYAGMGNKSSSSAGSPFGLSNWAIAAAKQGGLGGEIDAAVKGKGGIFGSLQGFLGQQSSQGSGESQGGSSCASELQNKALQGCGGARSHTSFPLLPESCGEEGIGSSGSKSETRCRVYSSEMESSSNQPAITETSRKRETGTSSMEDMPCVFTIGDGPGGRKVDGILYKYGKGEEVRIMCICHARFFTPKEFVKHAGGRDVKHPLRHIVVNPPSSPFR